MTETPTGTVVENAAARNREVFAALATADGRQDALDAVARLLGVGTDEAEQVLAAPLGSFVGNATDRPAHEGAQGFDLHTFRDEKAHTELFHRRSADDTSATGGQWDQDKTEAERRAGLQRMDLETAMWFVAVDTVRDQPVGLVFGEQTDDGDVDVAIWVAPEERKKGYGINALRACRTELASFFPGKHVVVRAPLSAAK